MAITINIYYTGTNGSAQAFAKEMIARGLVAKIRNEKGNLKYEYFCSCDDPENTLLLVDRWENQKALDVHHASAMMQEITKLRDKYDLTMKVERFIDDISDSKRDEQYIRK